MTTSKRERETIPDFKITSELLIEEIKEELYRLIDKYQSLVWYGRSGVSFHKHPPEVKKQVRDAQKSVERRFPRQIKQYGSVEGGSDFYFGFFSGCLASFRFVERALDTATFIDEDDGEEYPVGGIEMARELFPQTDT